MLKQNQSCLTKHTRLLRSNINQMMMLLTKLNDPCLQGGEFEVKKIFKEMSSYLSRNKVFVDLKPPETFAFHKPG